jgi:hypothetical protein
MPRRLPAVLALGLVLACASPTLPLPPPQAPDQLMTDADHVLLTSGCGGVEPSAFVTVLNTSLPASGEPLGVVLEATTCGSWSAKLYAHPTDVLDITQQVGQSFGTTRITVGR